MAGRQIGEGWIAGTGTKGVVVLQEYWGLVPHIKDLVERFAAEGFTAIAPDFWNGDVAKSADDAWNKLVALDLADATAKLRAAAAALRACGVTGKLGVVGFCMGGQLALLAGELLGDEVGAIVDFYGIHPNVRPDYAKITAPILGIFGERDPFVPPSAAKQLEADIHAAGGKIDVRVYPADHAFFNDSRPEVYDAKCAAAAWSETLGFFKKHL